MTFIKNRSFYQEAYRLLVFLLFVFFIHAANNHSFAGETKGLINLNTADAAQLVSLPGIGKKKAEAIVKFREENGNFKSLEDIQKVKGIGSKLFAKIKDLLTVADETAMKKE